MPVKLLNSDIALDTIAGAMDLDMFVEIKLEVIKAPDGNLWVRHVEAAKGHYPIYAPDRLVFQESLLEHFDISTTEKGKSIEG